MMWNRVKYKKKKLKLQLYICLYPRDTVRNINKTTGKIILQKVLFHIITDFSNHKGI